jgi:hypothetical protein
LWLVTPRSFFDCVNQSSNFHKVQTLHFVDGVPAVTASTPLSWCGSELVWFCSIVSLVPPLSPSATVQDNVFVMMVVSVQYQVMPGSLYDAFYRVSPHAMLLFQHSLSSRAVQHP